MLLTSTAAESIHQKRLVVVFLTDYHVTTCNKGCRWQVSDNHNNNSCNFMKSSILTSTSYLFILFSLLLSIEHICQQGNVSHSWEALNMFFALLYSAHPVFSNELNKFVDVKRPVIWKVLRLLFKNAYSHLCYLFWSNEKNLAFNYYIQRNQSLKTQRLTSITDE